MKSLAVLSDVNGVLPVLDAVLAEPEVRAADAIVACGDHAAGPQPVEVLDQLTGLDNIVLVRGNADRDWWHSPEETSRRWANRTRSISVQPVSSRQPTWICWRTRLIR